MRTNHDLSAFAAIEPAAMLAIEGGVVLAVSNFTGTAISKYLGQIEEQLAPDYDFSAPRNLDQRLP